MKKIERIALSLGKREYILPVCAEIIDIIYHYGEVYLYYTFDRAKCGTEKRTLIVTEPRNLDMQHKFYLSYFINSYGDVVFVVEDWSCTT